MSARRKQAVRKQTATVRRWPRLSLWLALPLLIVGLLGWGVAVLLDPATLPVREVKVQGRFEHLNQAMLSRALQGDFSVGFLRTDVERIRADVQALPWVAHATARRQWPDTIVVTIEEQQPVAIWEGKGLLNAEGEIFYPVKATFPAGLPEFRGSADETRLIVAAWRESQAVFEQLGRRIVSLELDRRHVLRMVLDDGVEVIAGREDVAQRLSRLVGLYRDALQGRGADIERIDLRYANGIAVRWKKGQAG
ncbi:MAG TPA: FtsQ-type POTRA domain-containing protein [Gammaproteobacteria bacterium]|nr:FtsQ-type POTRA domain-containing protein [Gammaproteobacteria bacterium]